MNSVEKLKSKNGELILIANEYNFRYHKHLRNSLIRFKCRANLKVCDSENVMWESSVLDRNHNPDDENKLERQIIKNGLERKAVESELLSKLLRSYFKKSKSTILITNVFIK